MKAPGGPIAPSPVKVAPAPAGLNLGIGKAVSSVTKDVLRINASPRQQKIRQYAAHIVAPPGGHIKPAFVTHLQKVAKADPNFQDDLNAEVHRQTQAAIAKQNSGALGIAGNVIYALTPGGVGESVAHGIHGIAHGHPIAGGADILASGVPFLRGPRAIAEGINAARVAEQGARVAEGTDAAAASFRAGKGLIRPAARAARHVPRTVTLGEHTTQFPQSAAHITAWAQRHLDRLSERLVAPAARLSESENPAARVAGKVVTKASATARVPIQAGKNLRQEARRAATLRAPEVRALTSGLKQPILDRKIGPSILHGDEGSQLAHFWWAQMPAKLRDVNGLRLVRSKLAEERAGLAETVAQKSHKAEGVRNTPQLRRAIQDLRSADQNIAKLDKVIAKPPKLQAHVIEAARTLMHDREQALVGAGKLDKVGAEARKGLVSRWLGLQPTGEEVYLGHRLEEQPGGITPRGGGVGRTKLPQGVGKTNNLVRVKTGTVRQSMHTAVEDWQRAMSYHFTTAAKDELAKMGEKIGTEGPKPGHIVVNPQGHKLPRTWKLDEQARAEAEGVKPEDVHLTDLEQYARNTIAAGADRQRLIDAASQAGHAADLRQVPEDVARRYFAQFVPHKVVAGTVPGVVNSTRLFTKAADLGHDLVYASLIYSNPGYIPANTVANLVMAGLHQGALLPVNIMRAGQAYFASGERLRDLLSAEVGMGATRAAASQGRYPGSKIMEAAIGKVAGVPDNVPRISAFIHEVAREGIISKVSPVLSKRDQGALVDLLTNPARRAVLNDIRDRAVQSMVDFERLGAHEKAVAKRLFFVWSWTRGATRYPARFVLDHPLRSVALGYTLAGAPGAPEDVRAKVRELTPTLAHGLPSWLQGAINTGHKTINGVKYPTVLPTGSISPVSVPVQEYETAKAILSGSKAATVNNVESFVNPVIPAGVDVARQQTRFGQHVSFGTAAKDQAMGLSPLTNLVRGELHPKAGGLYPGDATRLGRAERALRIFPVAVDPEQAYKARVREGTVPQSEKDIHTATAAVAAIDTQIKQLGNQVPSAWRKAAHTAVQAQAARTAAYQAAERKLPRGQKLPARDRYKITLDILHQRGMLSDEQYKSGLANSKGWTDRQYEHWRDYAWRTFGFGDAGGPGNVIQTIHHAHNQLPTVKNARTP